jgi:hypothetical protein
VLSALGLAATLSDLRILWQPAGTYGFSADAAGIVKDVEADSAASAAGVQRGDLIDGSWGETAGEVWVVAPGIPATASVTHAGVTRRITLVSRPLRFPKGERIVFPLRKLAGALFVIVGAVLVLVRPTRATWGFFLYCVGDNPFADSTWLFAQLPLLGDQWVAVAWSVFSAAGNVGLLAFAINFPRADIARWRSRADKSLPYLFAFSACLAVASNVVAWAAQVQWPLTTAALWIDFLYVVVAAVLVESYACTRGEDRQRTKWIAFGFAVGLLGLAAAHFSSLLTWRVFSAALFHERALSLLMAFVPFIVAYAVVRHNVFDFNVAVSHAAVYGVLTSAIVAAFALLHAYIARALVNQDVGLLLEVVIALAVGFALNAAHQSINRFIGQSLLHRTNATDTAAEVRALQEEMRALQRRLDALGGPTKTAENVGPKPFRGQVRGPGGGL